MAKKKRLPALSPRTAFQKRPGRPVTILDEPTLIRAEAQRRVGQTLRSIAEGLGVNHQHLCRVLRRRQAKTQRRGR